MSQHTPGPWHIGDERFGDWYIWGPDPKAYGYIAQVNACGSTTNPREEREANARLIVAAPKLLTACKRVAQSLRYHLVHASPWGADIVDVLDSAIAAAEQENGK